MDFMQRGSHQTQSGIGASSPVETSPGGHVKGKKSGVSWYRLTSVGLLFSITVLIVALVIFSATSRPKNEYKYVNTKELQAVFLNGGQVYFGNIQDLNDKFITVSNIYYLRVNQTVQPNQSTTTANNNDVSLVKLGCELHGPNDQMVINQSQVIFWENLKADGQVAKAVATYVKNNPNGQTCTTSSSSSSTTPTTTKP